MGKKAVLCPKCRGEKVVWRVPSLIVFGFEEKMPYPCDVCGGKGILIIDECLEMI